MNGATKYRFLVIVVMAISGCVPPTHNYFSTHRGQRSTKGQAEEQIRYICTGEEQERLRSLAADSEIVSFLDTFWTRRDPTPGTEKNETREEHLRRLAFANEHLGGSHLDRGRVYILYGPPDERNSNGLAEVDLFPYYAHTVEIWVYNRRASKHGFATIFDDQYPGFVKFVFADLHGYGVLEQIYSTEENEKVDSRVYLTNRRD